MPGQAAYAQLKRDLWMSALAVASLGIGIYQIKQPPIAGMTWLDYVDLTIVAIFIAEFAWSARRHGGFRRHAAARWWELPSMIPLTGGMLAGANGVSMIRGLRLLRLIRVIRVLRLVGVAMRLRRQVLFIAGVYKRSQAGGLLAVAGVIVLLGAVAALAAETHHNARFSSFPESLWWSLNMFTNVAYVDFQPATGVGRVVAGLLQILGIAFIGVFAGSMANAIMQESRADGGRGAGGLPKDGA